MSMTGWIILAVVIVVVLLLALAVWRSAERKKRSARAEALREEARTRAPEIGSTRTEAREAEVRADAARLEAERAQREAEAAQTALAQQEAAHEDRLREADRLDPEVNHKARDYEPTPPSTGTSSTGTHRAED
ncbi:MAG: hypothetical protein ACXVWW_10630 [Nocardioides sp.]